MSSASFYSDFDEYSMTPGSSSQESFCSGDSSPGSSPRSVHFRHDPDSLTPMYEPQGHEPRTPYSKDMLPAFKSFFGMEELKSEPTAFEGRYPQDSMIKREAAPSVRATIWSPPALTTNYIGVTRPADVPVAPATRKRKRGVSDDAMLDHCQDDAPSCGDRSKQRMAANLKERKRTRALNDAFVTLRKSVPMPDGDKASKFTTLRMAANYIEFLHEVYRAMAMDQSRESDKKTRAGVKMAMYAINQSSRCSRSLSVEELKYAFSLWLMEVKVAEESMTNLGENRLLGERPEDSDEEVSLDEFQPPSFRARTGPEQGTRPNHLKPPSRKNAKVLPERLIIFGNDE